MLWRDIQHARSRHLADRLGRSRLRPDRQDHRPTRRQL